MLDIFKQDAFSVVSLTDSINRLPFVPGRAGQMVPWNEEGITATVVGIEEMNGVLNIVNPTPRGGVGEPFGKDRRKLRVLAVPHYQINDGIYADEVQGVRAFGSETALDTVSALVNRRMQKFTANLDATLEFQRIGAIKGIILNGDGSTLYNLFTEFQVTQVAEIDFDLDNASPASGVLRAKCADIIRTIADEMEGVPFQGVHAFVGNAFFDALLAHKEVTQSYLNTPMANVLREPYVYPNGNKVYGAFEFGGIVWENYRGQVGGEAFVDTDKAFIFPVGAAGLFKTVFAPADYIETVNTVGRPRYTKQYAWPNDKGLSLEIQSNALSYCSRPRVLIKGKRT
jgi:hypothetical protein